MTGNLHLNIVAREFKEEIRETIEPYIYELVGMSLFHSSGIQLTWKPRTADQFPQNMV